MLCKDVVRLPWWSRIRGRHTPLSPIEWLQLLFCVGDPEANRQRIYNISVVVVKATHLALRFPQRGVFFHETAILTSFFGRLSYYDPHSLGGGSCSNSPVGRLSGSCSPNSATSCEGGITTPDVHRWYLFCGPDPIVFTLSTLWVNSKIVVYSVHTGLCNHLMNSSVYVVLES